MTNKELSNVFENIENSKDNIFDIYLELENYVDDYNTMEISKIIPTIYDAYKEYSKYSSSISGIMKKISTMDFSNITDSFNIDELLNQIPEEYKDVFSKIIEELE